MNTIACAVPTRPPDQFSLDQHEMTAGSPEDASAVRDTLTKAEMQNKVVAELQKSIRNCKLLMILDPWQKPIVLTRSWCLVSELEQLRSHHV